MLILSNHSFFILSHYLLIFFSHICSAELHDWKVRDPLSSLMMAEPLDVMRWTLISLTWELDMMK